MLMKKLLMTLMLFLALSLTGAAAETMYVNGGTADRVHLRASPMAEAGSLGLYFTGTPVERLAMTDNGWARVRVGSETGYMRTEYLAASATERFAACEVANTTSDWVNLRSGASFQAAAIGRLNNGEQVRLMGETASGWSYVTAGRQRGYVVTDFLSAGVGGGERPVQALSQIVGTTAAGGYIHACPVSQGQTSYFVAQDSEPVSIGDDGHFAGAEDIDVTTVRGATNFCYEFFIQTRSGYVRADHPGVESIANYRLYPDRGFVYSSANAGNAGAAYEDCLFSWDGTNLHLMRRATSQSQREYRTEGSSFVTVMHDRKLDLTVYAYTADGSVSLLHEEVIDLNDMDADKLEEMKQRLWTGLR